MKIELADCERVLMEEICDFRFKRRDVAKTYRLALDSSESASIDWARVNGAIMNRWSRSALEWIKKQAWSGRAFSA